MHIVYGAKIFKLTFPTITYCKMSRYHRTEKIITLGIVYKDECPCCHHIFNVGLLRGKQKLIMLHLQTE